ncbi:hypothetical protein ACI65C_005682 [Semiaphis heraclei]
MSRLPISKSTKRRRYLEEVETVDFIIENQEHFLPSSSTSTPSTSQINTTNLFTESQHHSSSFISSLNVNSTSGGTVSNIDFDDNSVDKLEFEYFSSDSDYDESSVLQARKMAEKATIQTDVSDDDYDNKSKRKLKSKKSDIFYSDCPDFSEFDSDISNINVYKSKVPGWSPSPKKSKNTSVIINKSDEYEDEAAVNTSAKCLANTTVVTNTPNSMSNPTEIQSGNNSSKLSYVNKTPESPKMSEVFASTPTELTGTFVSNNFQKEVLHTLTFIKHELRRVVNNQIELSQRLEVLETRSDSNVHIDNSKVPNPTLAFMFTVCCLMVVVRCSGAIRQQDMAQRQRINPTESPENP